MKQKPINEIEEASANKTIATVTSLAGMAEMKAVIGMIARDAARNTTLSLRNEGYFAEAKAEPKVAPKAPKADQKVDEALDTFATMFDDFLNSRENPLDAALVNHLVGMLFPKKPSS